MKLSETPTDEVFRMFVDTVWSEDPDPYAVQVLMREVLGRYGIEFDCSKLDSANIAAHLRQAMVELYEQIPSATQS